MSSVTVSDRDAIRVVTIERPDRRNAVDRTTAADLRVAAVDAVLGVFCWRVGVPLIDLRTVRLPRLIGDSRA